MDAPNERMLKTQFISELGLMGACFHNCGKDWRYSKLASLVRIIFEFTADARGITPKLAVTYHQKVAILT